jgi:hypothetical protein
MDLWVVLIGALLLLVSGVFTFERPVPRAERRSAKLVAAKRDDRGWDCRVDVTMDDGSVRRLPLRTSGRRPRQVCQIAVSSGAADHAVLVRGRQYALGAIPLLSGAYLVVGGLRGWITSAEFWNFVSGG